MNKSRFLVLSIPLFLVSCQNSTTTSSLISSASSSLDSTSQQRPIDAFFASLKDDNGTITKDDGGVVYYYGEATMEYYADGTQEGYITNGDAGIYDFTFDSNGAVVLGQYYSDGTYYHDGINLNVFTNFVGDIASFEPIENSENDYQVGLKTLLASYLYRFGDWSNTHSAELTTMTMTLDVASHSLMVYYVYQDAATEEIVEHSYTIEQVGSTANASVDAFLKNPTGAIQRDSFSERFLSGEDTLFDSGRGTIPFPKDTTVRFRDQGSSNPSISDEILSLSFTDLDTDDYRSSYAQQLLDAGFAYPVDEEGNPRTYTNQDVDWEMGMVAIKQHDYIQYSDCAVLLKYDDEERSLYVGFTFWNQSLESQDLTYPNALLADWNARHPSQMTPFFSFPASSHLVATLINGDLLHENYGTFQLAFDSVAAAREYYNIYAEAAKEASWKQGSSVITQAIAASSETLLTDTNYLFFYGPQNKTILLWGMFCDENNHAIVSFVFDVGVVRADTLRDEGLTR